MDPVRHREKYRRVNEVIWKNLHMCGELGKEVIIRMPIIPGYNDSEEELRQAAEALPEDPVGQAGGLLPVHQFGRVKYEQIGMDYTVDSGLSIPEERRTAGIEGI